MTIRPGDPWGETVEHDPAAPVARDERRAIALWESGTKGPVFLRRGSLRRALGLEPRGRRQRVAVTCDALAVEVSWRGRTRRRHALGNVVIVSESVRPRTWIVSNTGWWLGRHLSVRAHPNDGMLDVIEIDASMGFVQRLRAFQRARRGDHLPHPGLRSSAASHLEIERVGPVHTWIDGSYAGRAERIEVTVVPDALHVRA